MTFESVYIAIQAQKTPLIILMLLTPWAAFVLCKLIPGKREEPFVLSANLTLSVISLILWAGYLAYATNTGGWTLVVKQADLILLFLPMYHLIASLWLSRQCIPLEFIPAFRTLQGLALMAGAFLALSWVLSRIRIVLFSFMPFSTFLWGLALLVGLGYIGYLRVFGQER
ncbi:MAG: hypothetical protein QNJ46_19240 [Leptolyngbyaceae cyanobacterium MO_188.B28]|nr:hypothetical protein [Leptolyngbyaceae cyanobacterium MO_188.B28]